MGKKDKTGLMKQPVDHHIQQSRVRAGNWRSSILNLVSDRQMGDQIVLGILYIK